jgi:hypothetical protein
MRNAIGRQEAIDPLERAFAHTAAMPMTGANEGSRARRRAYKYFSEQRWISMLVGNLRHSLASR